MTFLLVCDGPDNLSGLEQGLERSPDSRILRVNTGPDALELIRDNTAKIDLVVVDQTIGGVPGLGWVEKMVETNPMVNTALVSDLPDREFHEHTEGLGVLMAIPPEAQASDAVAVIERLAKVLGLYQNLSSQRTDGLC